MLNAFRLSLFAPVQLSSFFSLKDIYLRGGLKAALLSLINFLLLSQLLFNRWDDILGTTSFVQLAISSNRTGEFPMLVKLLSRLEKESQLSDC